LLEVTERILLGFGLVGSVAGVWWLDVVLPEDA